MKIHQCEKPVPIKCIVCGKTHTKQMLFIKYGDEAWYTVNFCSLRHFKKTGIPYEITTKGEKFTSFQGFTLRIDEIEINSDIDVDTKLFE